MSSFDSVAARVVQRPWRRACVALAAALSAVGCGDGTSSTRAPTLGNVTFAPAEVGRPVATLESPDGHGQVGFVHGHLLVITSSDAGGSPDDGGIELWDLSDPRAPRRAARHEDSQTHRLREPHGFGFARYGARDLLAAQSLEGLMIWDVTGVPEVTLVADLELPGIDPGNYAGNWWVFWQAPYIYVAGRNAGLYVVDARDPDAPVLAAHLPTGELGGLGPAIVQALGGLLIATSNPPGRILTMDVSDPLHPRPLASVQGARGYSHLFAGGRLLEAGGQGDPARLYMRTIGHDGAIGAEVAVGEGLGDGGYGSYQDGVFHAGFSDHYARFDLNALTLLGTTTGGIEDSDEDFAFVLGNFTFVGNDHEGRSTLIPHQAAPDTTPPEVEFVHPADGATAVAETTCIGLSFSDHVDLASLSRATVRVTATGGAPLSGWFSLQGGLVNFAPSAPLAELTDYTVEVEGVRDLAGNAAPRFASTFTTRAAPGVGAGPPEVRVESLGPALVGATVFLDVDVLGGAPATSYVWDFGDGSPPTPPSPNPVAQHVYGAPGRYTALLRAANAAGEGSAAAVQIVHRALTATAPRSASSIAATSAFAYFCNPDNGTLTALLGSTSAKAFEVPVDAGPASVAVAPDGRLWVACRDADTLVVLDPADGTRLFTFPLRHGAAPAAIVFPPGDDRALVALEGAGEVVRVSASGALLATAALGGRPHGLAVSGDGALVLVTELEARGGTARVHELDGHTLTWSRAVSLVESPGPDTEASARGTPNTLTDVVLTPDGTAALVASKQDNLQRGLWRDGQLLDFQSTSRAIVSRLDLATHTDELAARIDLNDRALPLSLVTSPRGDIVFVALMGNDVVDVFDTWRGTHLAELPAGSGPRGLALNPTATKLYVHDRLGRTATVLDIRDLLAGRAATAPQLVRRGLVANELLAPAVLRGKRLFYRASDLRMARDGYLSCAVCHLDGGGDGATFDFTQDGEGLRNTITLHGRAGLGHGRLHWTANFDEVQDFEGPIRSLGGGLGFLSEAQFALTADPLGPPKAGLSAALDDLAAYVGSLVDFPRSPYRNPDGTRTAAGLAGEAVFLAAGCADCHPAPHYTDGLRHDVGTALSSSGAGVGQAGCETPTVRGIWATAPYLHDGRLATLEEVLALPGHGAHLTSPDRAALAAFLRELE